MTGETLLTTALYPDLVMKMVCDRQRTTPQRAAPQQSSHRGKSIDCKPTVGGAGRGGPRQATDTAGQGRRGRGKGGRGAGRGGRGVV
eukprot:5991808-Prymnesium_polylepis.3